VGPILSEISLNPLLAKIPLGGPNPGERIPIFLWGLKFLPGD